MITRPDDKPIRWDECVGNLNEVDLFHAPVFQCDVEVGTGEEALEWLYGQLNTVQRQRFKEVLTTFWDSSQRDGEGHHRITMYNLVRDVLWIHFEAKGQAGPRILRIPFYGAVEFGS